MGPRKSHGRLMIAMIALAVVILALINQPAAEAGMKLGASGTTTLITIKSPMTGAAASAKSETNYNQEYLEKTWEPKADALISGTSQADPAEVINEAKKFQDQDLARYAKTKIGELAAKSPSINRKGALIAINDLLGDLNSATKNPKLNEAMANEFQGKLSPDSDFTTPSSLSLKGNTLTNGKISIPLEKLANSKVVALQDGGFLIDGVKITESAKHLATSEQNGKRSINGNFDGVSLKINDIDPEAGIEVLPRNPEDIDEGYLIKSKKPTNIETPAFKGTLGKDGEAGGAMADAYKSNNGFETNGKRPWKSNTKQFLPDQDLSMSGQGKTSFRYENNQAPEVTSSESGIIIGKQTFTGKTADGTATETKIKFGQVHHDQLGNNEAWWLGPTKYTARGLLEVKTLDNNGNQALKHQGSDENTVIRLYQLPGTQPYDYLTVYNTDPKKTGQLAIVHFQDDENNVKFTRDSEGLKITPSSKAGVFKTPFGNPLELSNQGEDSSKYTHAYLKDNKFTPGRLPDTSNQPPSMSTPGPTVGPAASAAPEPEAPPAATESAAETRRESGPSPAEPDEEGEEGQETTGPTTSSIAPKEKPKLPSIPVTDEMRNSKNGAARIYSKLLDYANKIEDPERRAEVLAKIQNGMGKVTAAYESAPPETKSSGLTALQPVASVLSGAINAVARVTGGSQAASTPTAVATTPAVAPIASAPVSTPAAGGQLAASPIAPSPTLSANTAQIPDSTFSIPEPVRAAQIQGLVEVPFEDATKFVKYNQLQPGDVIVHDYNTQGYIDAFRYESSSRSYKALINPKQFSGGAITEQKMSQWLKDWGGWRVGEKKRAIS